MGLNFGTPTADLPAQGESFDADDVWIKPLKDGDNTIRFLSPLSDKMGWIGYREHFDPSVKRYFPCSEESSCQGCKAPSEEMRKRSRRVITNALNAQGFGMILKLPASLFEDLEDRAKKVKADRDEEITDRDFLLVRKGKGLETRYRFEPLDKTPCDYSGELYDLKKALSNQFLSYLEKLAGDEGAGDEGAHEEPVRGNDEAQNGGWDDQTAPEWVKDTEKMKAEREASEEPIEDWPTSRMKAWLDNEGVEYPLRASKNTLIGMIEEQQAKAKA